MPYAMPSPSSPDDVPLDLPPLKLRPKHRRTRSSQPTFSNERGPGAFASLPHLPRRKSIGDKKPLFHFTDDPDSDSSDEPSPTSNSLGLTVDTANLRPDTPPLSPHLSTSSLPFPSKGSPLPSPAPPSPVSPPSASPSLPRTPSTPVILANGKPLKPSLKSSHSTPNIPGLRLHTRAQSEPSTPSNGPVKNVHFPEKDALQSVRVFDKSGKPASVSKTGPFADETETETDYDSSANNTYPFPAMSPAPSIANQTYELDQHLTTAIPTRQPPQYANLHFESIVLPPTRPPMLRGTVLVRNIAFTKEVAVRFTLDDWQTTSEVICKYVASLPSLPPPFLEPRTVGDLAASVSPDGWDRFSFLIRLEDFERKLSERTLWFVGRYSVPGVGEWWDNNSGQNYRVAFQKVASSARHAGSSSPILDNSQQRTFSAPPTLKGTPTTGAVMHENAQAMTGNSLSKLHLPAPRIQPGATGTSLRSPMLVRSHSSPQPSSQSPRPAFSSLPSRLNLLNYSAPTPATPPLTPPQSRRPSIGTPAEQSPQSMSAIIGGMPATTPRSDVRWSSSPPSPPSPPSYFSSSHTPAATASEKQKAKEIVAAPTSSLASDSSYAAFVKQWCFVQSPTPSPTTNNTAPRPQAEGNHWLGVGADSLGLYGSPLRSESPIMASFRA